jgi:uncharacterized protein YwgA
MNKLAQEAVIVGLARRLHDNGSWGGETHVQKAAYLLHGLTGISFDFEFILYKHGPFSFELRDELTSMRSDGLIDRQTQSPPYGPRIVTTDRGRQLEERFAKTMNRYRPQLDWIAAKVGDRGVMDLERLATALWVTRRMGNSASAQQRAEALNELKPHVSIPLATEAVQEIDQLISESSALPAA